MKSGKSGKPAKKASKSVNWAKIVIVLVCILFAGIMIMSTLGTNWLVTTKPLGNGDVAAIDVTLKDAYNRPVFTTDQRLYNATIQNGGLVMLAAPMNIPVNITTENLIDPVNAFLPGTGATSFAFLGPEYNDIAEGIVGMKQGEKKTISFTQNPAFQRSLTPAEFAQIGGNFTMSKIGDQLILGFTTSPMIAAENNTSSQYALRTVPITGKTDDNLTINYGYTSADIYIRAVSSANK
jgi:hypothetical protein